ncbi:MAG: hypothetical protein HFH86_04720 [Bacilli bacterium]|nr:hypothetical protein [Bacilli bacterium]
MKELLYHFIWFGVFFVIIFIVYFFLLRFKVKQKNYQSFGEMNYLIRKFHLDVTKMSYWKVIIPISFINAFIISFVATFVMMISMSMIWQLLCGFVLLMALIYSIYEIYGRHLQKKYGKDDIK